MGAAFHEGMARLGERVERSSGAAPPLNSGVGAKKSASLDGSPLAIAIRGALENACVIELVGELDLATVPKLEARLSEAMDSHHGVVLDLSRLGFIDSSGLGLLIKAHREAEEDRELQIVIAAGSQVERVFELTGIDRALPISHDCDQAIAALAPPAPLGKGRAA